MAFDDNDVVINVVANDKTGNALNSIRTQFRSLGRELSMVGMTMTATFTLPIVAAVTAMVKSGTDASKAVAEARKNLVEAIAGGDKAKIATAQAAWDALTPSIKATAAAYDAMTKAIQPARDELEKVGATLLTALVPIVQQLAPILLKMVDQLQLAVTWFSNLPIGTQEAVLGVVAFLAVLGPGIVMLGKTVELIGAFAGIAEHLGVVLPTASAAMKVFGVSSLEGVAPLLAALAPVVLLGAAIGLLIYTIITLGPQAWNTLKQIVGIVSMELGAAFAGVANVVVGVFTTIISWAKAAYDWIVKTIQAIENLATHGGVFSPVPGSSVGADQTGSVPTPSSSGGYVTPVSPAGGGIQIHIHNNSPISLGNQDEADNVLYPMIVRGLHAAGVRTPG